MASLVRSSRERRSETVHIPVRPRQKALQSAVLGGTYVSPFGTSPCEGGVCSPVDSYLSSESRTSFESNFSELSLSSSFDTRLPSSLSCTAAEDPPITLPASYPSYPSLARQPLPDEHVAYVRKLVKKLRPGQQLPARKVRLLGRGGVGEVHLLELTAADGSTLHLAQKAILPTARGYDAVRHSRELAAMRVAASACPFILRLYGSTSGANGKPPYALFTEYAPLGSLADLIAERRRQRNNIAPYLEEHEIRWLGARVLLALATLHDLGFMHRDVCPHNIYRSASGHPLLADFDAAVALDGDGLAGGPAGRLASAAPEVRAASYGGGLYGAKADLWGLGVVLLEMLTDQQVCDGPSLAGCSEELRGLLLEGLLVPQARRLDAAGAKLHPFFQGVDWAQMEFEEAPPSLRRSAA